MRHPFLLFLPLLPLLFFLQEDLNFIVTTFVHSHAYLITLIIISLPADYHLNWSRRYIRIDFISFNTIMNLLHRRLTITAKLLWPVMVFPTVSRTFTDTSTSSTFSWNLVEILADVATLFYVAALLTVTRLCRSFSSSSGPWWWDQLWGGGEGGDDDDEVLRLRCGNDDDRGF